MWCLVPRLPRSVGFGPVRPPPRLARTEQLSRIRSGWPRSIASRTAWTRCSRLTAAQSASRRRRVEPLAWAEVARRLRHGVPSRGNRRRVASTRTVSAGGCPGPGSPRPSHRSTTVAIRSKVLTSNPVPFPRLKGQRWAPARQPGRSGHLHLRWMWKPPLSEHFEGPILMGSEEYPPIGEHERRAFIRDLLARFRDAGLELRCVTES